ncbi:MAG TPA: molecular chaperone DnaK, partial [Candidatus Bathyarchaeia archaeon]|nr:molecular chaperone DnaK [Candidatus Bathyarchaeia archaeon]
AAVTEAKESMKSEDETVLKQAAEKLGQLAHRLAEQMYKEASSSAPPPPPEGEAESKETEGEVVDAEYEDPAKK